MQRWDLQPGGARAAPAGPAKAGKRVRLTAFCALAACATSVVASHPHLAAPARRSADDCGKAEDCFRRGIQALDTGKFDDAAKLMKVSLDKKPEDGQLVRIYGTRYQSYLPHYYRGLALYQQQKCSDAIEEWAKSLKVGAVQRTEERGVFNAYLGECQKRLLSEPPRQAPAPQPAAQPQKPPGIPR